VQSIETLKHLNKEVTDVKGQHLDFFRSLLIEAQSIVHWLNLQYKFHFRCIMATHIPAASVLIILNFYREGIVSSILHDHSLHFVCPDLLVAVCETSYGIRG
jgi:hypothetical protein